MNIKKYVLLLSAMLTLFIATFTGCSSIAATNTVETCVISHEQYSKKSDLESAVQPDHFEANQNIYASVYFIESPLGMEYVARWTADGNEIKMEAKKMQSDRHGIIVFSLEAEYVKTGTILFEIVYGDDVLLTKEILVQ